MDKITIPQMKTMKQAQTAENLKAELDEKARIGRQKCPCVRCRGAGYLNDLPINNYFGLMAWAEQCVSPEQIFWCDCEIGQKKRAEYVAEIGSYIERVDTRRFKHAGIPERFQRLAFEGIPTRLMAGKEKAIEKAKEYAETGLVTSGKNKRPGLMFIGKPGVGKTGILSVAFQARVESGQHGLWIELYQFFSEIQGSYSGEQDTDVLMRSAGEIDLLFLDDCGDPDRRDKFGKITAETNDKRNILWQILDYRHGAKLPTLLTSNLTRSDFDTQWGTRIGSRVWEMALIVPVGGADLREAM